MCGIWAHNYRKRKTIKSLYRHIGVTCNIILYVIMWYIFGQKFKSQRAVEKDRRRRQHQQDTRRTRYKQLGYTFCELVSNSTTRTPATDTTNGRAHNNSTTCCATNSPQTDKNLPHPNILTCRDVGLWHCDVANLLFVVSLSVGGVR